MLARIVMAELGVPRATVIVTDDDGKNHSYIVRLRDWIAPNGEQYLLLGECPEIQNLDARAAINAALLEFQEYQVPFENPGYAPE